MVSIVKEREKKSACVMLKALEIAPIEMHEINIVVWLCVIQSQNCPSKTDLLGEDSSRTRVMPKECELRP